MSFGKPFNGQMSDSFRTAIFIILSGGFQDAYTFICRGEVFANAQTGNIVLLSAALFRGEWQVVLKYLIPVLSFVAGIIIAEVIHSRLKFYKRFHWRQIVLFFEIIILFGVGFMPHTLDAFANALVSFVCAMQVQSFHKVRGHAYASTMCIGNMRAGTEALCAYFRVKDKAVLKKALTYFGVILIFAAGAGIGSILTRVFACRAIWSCCILLAVSLFMMFVPESKKE